MNIDNNKEELLSKTIELLRFPLAVAVVFIHIVCMNNIDIKLLHENPLSGESIYIFIVICFTKVLPLIAVPTFFMISGYLFFFKLKNWNIDVYLGKLKKRVFSLLIPYLLWNILFVLSEYIIYGITGKDISIITRTYSDKGWYSIFFCATPSVGDIISTPVNTPLWFIRDLIVMVILSPIVYILIKNFKIWYVSVLGICFIFFFWFRIPGFGISAFFFFSLGAYFSLNKLNFVEVFRKYRSMFYSISLILLLIAIWYNGESTSIGYYAKRLYILFGVPAVVCLFSEFIIKDRIKPSKFLANSSFFIFALHMLIILPYTMAIINKLLPSNLPIVMIIKYFSYSIITVIICLLIYGLMRKIMPKTLSILTGNR
jgi:Acyltransferase family.